MALNTRKTLVAAVFFGLCISTAHPLTEKGANRWALATGTILGLAAGAGVGFGADSKTSNHSESIALGAAAGVVTFLITYYLSHKFLYKYTPTPTLEYVEGIIKAVEKDSEFAKDFANMSQDKVLKNLSNKTSLEDVLYKFDKFDESMEYATRRLYSIKPNLDSDELKKFYKKVNKNSKELISYLNLRVTLITLAFATTDKLLTSEFQNYAEFGINGNPDISSATSQLNKLSRYINNTEKLLNSLKTKQHKNNDLNNSIYTIDELEKCIKFLKNLIALRIAQFNAFAIEKSFAQDIITSGYFSNENDLSTALNAHSQTSWPLVIAKQNLNESLKKLTASYQNAYQIFNAFEPSQQEYKIQSTTLINKLQILINMVENNLTLIAKSRDYNYQVGLFEQHQEMERQRRLEEERIRRQEEMERQRLEQERQLELARIAHEQNMAWEKKRQENARAESQRQHERELLNQKLEHEKQLEREKMYLKQNQQKPSTPANTTYNTYYTTVATPVTTVPTYSTGYDMPAQKQSYPTGYENTAPSAPPVEPEEANLFANTVPEYNPNYAPSAPPMDEEDNQPPSYESLYPSNPNYAPSAPPMD